MSIIYLWLQLPVTFSDLPLTTFPGKNKASNFIPEGIMIYMVLQSVRRTTTVVTYYTGELLPHLFTLTRRRLFSATLLNPHELLPIQKYGTLYCPDFPPLPMAKAIDRLAITANLQLIIRF